MTVALLQRPNRQRRHQIPSCLHLRFRWQEARIIIEGAVAYARNLKMRMSVVVLDDGGHLVSADRMDGTSFNSEHQAKGKAFTSIISRQPSAAVAELMTTAPQPILRHHEYVAGPSLHRFRRTASHC